MIGGARARRDEGFTLIEALVALTVLAVAGIALLGAAEGHIRRIDDIESRTIARWVAENRLIGIMVAGRLPDAEARVAMLGDTWISRATTRPTDDPALFAVEVRVFRAREATRALVLLTGFVDVQGGGS